ncbi:MAG: hypothetical protein ABIG89_05900 [Candidatus Woesearchaeota archaeon]
MISHKEQMELFNLVSKHLKSDVTAYAFGGNAMMFYGYKDDTKDIDILFESTKERKEFIHVIELLGFKETSPMKIYIDEKLRNPSRPLMYIKDDIRFDIFVKKIFKTLLSPKMKDNLFSVHEFKGRHSLRLKILRKEHLVILKTVTERDKDFEDIITITKTDKDFDWQYLIDEVIWQYQNGDSWILLDTEKMLIELKKYIHVPEKFIKQLYNLKI